MYRLCICCIGALVLGASLGARDARSQGPARQPGEKYALLVGVRQYDKNELRNLPYSEPDVTELTRVLKESG